MTCYHWSANLFLLVFDHGWSSERDRNDVTIDRTGNAMSLPRARFAFIRAHSVNKGDATASPFIWPLLLTDYTREHELDRADARVY